MLQGEASECIRIIQLLPTKYYFMNELRRLLIFVFLYQSKAQGLSTWLRIQTGMESFVCDTLAAASIFSPQRMVPNMYIYHSQVQTEMFLILRLRQAPTVL